MRYGFSTGGKDVANKKGKKVPGTGLRLMDGTKIDYPFDRKAYSVLDGNFVFGRAPLIPGQRISMGVYRK